MDLTFLVIDIGTSSLKAALMNHRGEVLSSVRRRIMGPSEHTEGFVSERWIQALVDSLPRLAGPAHLDGIVISGNGPTVVAVDSQGRDIGDPLLWLDGRSVELEGSRSFYLPKIRWLHTHNPRAKDVRWYLPFPEYLIHVLTGEAVAIVPGESFHQYLWSPEDVERSGIDSSFLPPFVPVAEPVGRVHGVAAARFGLPEGTPVISAGSDFHMSLVGTNTLHPGRTCDRAGTSEGINHCSDHPVDNTALRTLPHVIPGLFNVAGILSSTGLLFEWFREISGQKGRDYGDMMLDILNARDDADAPWFFPTAHRRESWEFRRGMFIGLGAQHSRADMGRAVVLSIGFAVREAVLSLRENQCPVAELRACGGQARNGLWNQMKADITGVPVLVPAVADAELVGNLCCGLVACRERDSLQEAADSVVHTLHTWEPNAARHREYVQRHEHYRDRFERFRVALEAC